ncbi:hypothetical protein EAI_01566 [Harpegnathos saltator]|uniref:Uncharacterized protein n=1 Tax=Harpegnathos saltator TaxID=610380 RepID=E2BPL9_HARSA|nr:hypothetical protein EAI_01566 [Harpegnathos saltator]
MAKCFGTFAGKGEIDYSVYERERRHRHRACRYSEAVKRLAKNSVNYAGVFSDARNTRLTWRYRGFSEEILQFKPQLLSDGVRWRDDQARPHSAVGSYRQFRDAERFVGPEVITNGYQLSVSFGFTSSYLASRPPLRIRKSRICPADTFAQCCKKQLNKGE